MATKVTFDAINRLIIVKEGVTEIDAKIDLYSDAKEDWKEDATLNKLRLPFRTSAGDPLPGGLVVGAYFFLQNQAGWRIRPHEADHELMIKGNLYPEDEGLPLFVPTLGGYTVSISMERSSLTQVPDLPGLAEEVWTTQGRGTKLDEAHEGVSRLPSDPASQTTLEAHITDEVDALGTHVTDEVEELESVAAKEATLEDIKGIEWVDETLKKIVELVDELEPELVYSSPHSIAQQIERKRGK